MPKAENVSVGKPNVSGAIFRAPLGTTLPKNVSEKLADAFKDMGYVSEDGTTNTNSPSSSNIKAWGGAIVYSYQEEKPDEWKFKLIETLNPDVSEMVYGSGNVSGNLDEGMEIRANASEGEEACYIIDMLLRGNVMKRVVIPDGKVKEVGDITYVDNDVIGYDITLSALPDESQNTHYEYVQRVKAAPTSFTVTFNSNGGSEVPPQEVEAGATVTKPEDPTKADGTFDGWYSDEEFTTAWDFDADTVEGSITLYAKWTEA